VWWEESAVSSTTDGNQNVKHRDLISIMNSKLRKTIFELLVRRTVDALGLLKQVIVKGELSKVMS
jgi:hypothetical protein